MRMAKVEEDVIKTVEGFCTVEEEERIHAEEEQRIRAEEIRAAEEKIRRRADRENEIRADDGSMCCVVCKWCVTNGVDSWSPVDCKICVAKAAAFNRIKAAGGDSIQAAKDSASRAVADVCVLKFLPNKYRKKPEVRRRGRVPQDYIQRLLTNPQLETLRPLPEDYFEKDPQYRELMKDVAGTVLLTIEEDENVLYQFFKKGFADMEIVREGNC